MLKVKLKYDSWSNHDGRLVMSTLAKHGIEVKRTVIGIDYKSVYCIFEDQAQLNQIINIINMQSSCPVLVASKHKVFNFAEWWSGKS